MPTWIDRFDLFPEDLSLTKQAFAEQFTKELLEASGVRYKDNHLHVIQDWLAHVGTDKRSYRKLAERVGLSSHNTVTRILKKFLPDKLELNADELDELFKHAYDEYTQRQESSKEDPPLPTTQPTESRPARDVRSLLRLASDRWNHRSDASSSATATARPTRQAAGHIGLPLASQGQHRAMHRSANGSSVFHPRGERLLQHHLSSLNGSAQSD